MLLPVYYCQDLRFVELFLALEKYQNTQVHIIPLKLKCLFVFGVTFCFLYVTFFAVFDVLKHLIIITQPFPDRQNEHKVFRCSCGRQRVFPVYCVLSALGFCIPLLAE